MKKLISSITCCCAIAIALAQPTNKMNYQAVARSASGGVFANQLMGIRITIENGSSGPILYQERQTPTTNQFGLFTLQIGSGSALSGVYNNIDWSTGNQWLLVDMDTSGGTSYSTMGESQLMSVPFANYAAAAADNNWLINGIDIYNRNSGNVGIGITAPAFPLDVSGSQSRTANFDNTGVDVGNFGLASSCYNSPNWGYGIIGRGGYLGVRGYAEIAGTGSRIGVDGIGQNGANANYGVSGTGSYGTVAFGIYGSAYGATTNYAGYFSGNVYATGTITSSDKKLKKDIQPLSGGLSLLMSLRPSSYYFRDDEYKSMNLPKEKQYGLIAQDVEKVIPSIVSDNIQPAQLNEVTREEIAPEIHFKGLNYTQLVPVLITGIQEQEAKIERLEKEIEMLKKK